jgi:hypothetical protein
MEKMIVNETKTTPYISFDFIKGVILIKGRSIPEDAVNFYEIVHNNLNLFNKISKPLIIICEFEYLNTSSNREIFSILKKMKDVIKRVVVEWCYEEDDDTIEDIGHLFEETLNMKFIFKKIK